MKRLILGVICGILFAGLFAGCAQQTPEEKFLGHWERIVAILKENKAKPYEAASRLKEYLDANLGGMRELLGQLGNNPDLAKNQAFIEREIKVRQAIIELETKEAALLENPEVKAALTPLGGLNF